MLSRYALYFLTKLFLETRPEDSFDIWMWWLRYTDIQYKHSQEVKILKMKIFLRLTVTPIKEKVAA